MGIPNWMLKLGSEALHKVVPPAAEFLNVYLADKQAREVMPPKRADDRASAIGTAALVGFTPVGVAAMAAPSLLQESVNAARKNNITNSVGLNPLTGTGPSVETMAKLANILKITDPTNIGALIADRNNPDLIKIRNEFKLDPDARLEQIRKYYEIKKLTEQ